MLGFHKNYYFREVTDFVDDKNETGFCEEWKSFQDPLTSRDRRWSFTFDTQEELVEGESNESCAQEDEEVVHPHSLHVPPKKDLSVEVGDSCDGEDIFLLSKEKADPGKDGSKENVAASYLFVTY